MQKREILLVRRNSGAALVMFDSPGRYNSLGRNAIQDLSLAIEKAETDNTIKALILISGKPESFILGADLKEIRQAKDKQELFDISSQGHALFNRIASIGKPVITAVNGLCLGGGLELALTAHARIATPGPETQFGLPETRLGLIPGLGGTQRLPRLIGLKAALELIMSAEPIGAEEALTLGLIDAICDPDDLIEEAEKMALSMIATGDWTNKFNSQISEPEKSLKLLSITERAVRLKTKGNYPAQTKVLEVIKAGLLNGVKAGSELEAEVFSELAASSTAANLIALSINMEIAKQSAFSLCQKYPESEIDSVAIIGAGKMGIGLAVLSATNGLATTLKTNADKLESVSEEIHSQAQTVVNRLLKNGGNKESLTEEFLDLLAVTAKDSDLEEADLILECVKEDEEIKKIVLARCDANRNSQSIIASNTSGLSIQKLSKSLANPADFVGIHFFHPVARMPLVEVVYHPSTSKETLARALSFIDILDKTAVLVKDSPGFLINRLLTAYLVEFARMMEVAPLNWIESAALEFGMPIGPMQLMDEVGIDVAFSVAANLYESFGERMKLPIMFYKVSALGVKGKKTGSGFYSWENDKPVQVNPELLSGTGTTVSPEPCPPEEKQRLAERLILPMIDEAARCLEERIINRPREVDVAVVLGIGFPAFRGGVLRYADSLGMKNLCQRLESIYKQSPDCQRQVSGLLTSYAASGRNFYSLSEKSE